MIRDKKIFHNKEEGTRAEIFHSDVLNHSGWYVRLIDCESGEQVGPTKIYPIERRDEALAYCLKIGNITEEIGRPYWTPIEYLKP